MSQSRLIVGAGVKVLINGTVIGECNSLEWESTTLKKEIVGVDAVIPFELAHTSSKLIGKVGLYRAKGRGGLEGYGIVSNFEDAPRERYISILVLDKQTDEPLFECSTAVITGQRWQVASRGVMVGSFSFQGITWNNETT